MDNEIPVPALARLAELLAGCQAQWVVGGSTGLALRGAVLDRAPRDVDVYTDDGDVGLIHDKLVSYALDGPEDNRTERYHSTLSHYRIAGSAIELVGNFRVTALQSAYQTEVSEFLFAHSDQIDVDGRKIWLVPLGHELIFNLLRERKDRAAIAGQLIARQPDKHMPVVHALIRRNQLAEPIVAEALELSQEKLHADRERQL